MELKAQKRGSALLMTVFVIVLLSALVGGILQMNTEEIQLVRNQIWAAEAVSVAEAGLNDALAEIRADSEWKKGFTDKAFNGGLYTVAVDGSTITSTGTSARGFIAKVEAEITVGITSPHVIGIDSLRINE